MVCLVADRYGQPAAAQDEDALVGGARSPGGLGRGIGKQAVRIGMEARRIAGASVGAAYWRCFCWTGSTAIAVIMTSIGAFVVGTETVGQLEMLTEGVLELP
jgi:hypothetical protein